MKKKEKIWFWIFLIMFILPEFIFSFLISSISSFLGVVSFPFIYKMFVSQQFFIDNQIYLFLALVVEFLGLLGLLISNIRFSNNKFIRILLVVLLIFLGFTFIIGYSISNMSFF